MDNPKIPLYLLALNSPGHVNAPEEKKYEVIPVPYQRGLFPGGEVFFRLDEPEKISGRPVLVTARLRSSEDVMALLMATDALVRAHTASLTLKLYYVPYGRQDRVATAGESLSLSVMGELLRGLPYDNIFILEPHSDATTVALGRNVTALSSGSEGFSAFVRQQLLLENEGPGLENVVLVSPDAGASKRLERMAQELGITDLAEGKKHRDLSTNKLSGFGVDRASFAGKTALIVDDLCDAGGTFIGLAEVLRERGAASVELMVTHGLFTKGFDPFLGSIDRVYTTNSFRDMKELMAATPQLKVREFKLHLF